jgi:hypothetical protein
MALLKRLVGRLGGIGRNGADARLREHKVSEWDIQTELGHKCPSMTELHTTFDPAYLKDAAKALDKLVRADARKGRPHRKEKWQGISER